jgi:serine/threonine protein kinase
MVKAGKDACPLCGGQHDPDSLVCPITGLSLRFSDPERAVGQVIGGGKYKLLRLIGRGGMGSVYEALNQQIDKHVAIKVLLPESSRIEQVTERFKREARSAASIGHENIVDIYDLDTTEDGVVYIVMELLSGCDLADLLKSCRCLPVERVCTIGVQTARALGAAHERGIIHRDMKPENIFLTRRKSGEVVKIVDFGIAMIKEHGSLSRLTTDGILLGTPYYMSPEQARGSKDLDHRVDTYALGAVLFEALTGTVLFGGETYLEVISKHQIEAPPLLEERKPDLAVPRQVDSLIMAMLQKDPAKRPATMEEVEKALLPFSAERRASTAPDTGDRHEGFAETMADTGRSPLVSSPSTDGKLHTTPVQWEETAVSGKLLTSKRITAIALIAFLFIVSTLAVILVMNRNRKEKADPVTYPISSAPVTKKTAGEPSARITLSIAASPPEAVIKLNGKALQGNPVEVKVPRSSDEATITAEAQGYLSEIRKVTLDKDRTIPIALGKKPQKILKDKPEEKDLTAPPDKPAKTKKGLGSITVSDDSPYKQ